MQRHRDVSRIGNACRHLGHERLVVEVIGGRDEQDVELPALGVPLESTRRVDAGEAGADDHDLRPLGVGIDGDRLNSVAVRRGHGMSTVRGLGHVARHGYADHRRRQYEPEIA